MSIDTEQTKYYFSYMSMKINGPFRYVLDLTTVLLRRMIFRRIIEPQNAVEKEA